MVYGAPPSRHTYNVDRCFLRGVRMLLAKTFCSTKIYFLVVTYGRLVGSGFQAHNWYRHVCYLCHLGIETLIDVWSNTCGFCFGGDLIPKWTGWAIPPMQAVGQNRQPGEFARLWRIYPHRSDEFTPIVLASFPYDLGIDYFVLYVF